MNRGDAPNDALQDVTGANFSRLVLHGDGPIAVEFMSYGCAHCGAIEPVVQAVAAELEGQESIFRVNIGLEPELAESFAVQGTPTFVMFFGGSEVGRVEGPSPQRSTLLAELTRPFER
jgi:thioredoxin 1